MHILIVEHENNVAKMTETKLQSAGFTTLATPSGTEAVALAKMYDFDLIILNQDLPDMCGFVALRAFREGKIRTPVLMVSGDFSMEKMLRCFGLGADDYMKKPFRVEELAARVRAIILRTNGHSSPKVKIGDIVIELETRHVTVAGQRMEMTRREYQVLELLVIRKGGTVTKEAFLNHLYGGRDEPDQKIIDVYVCKVRKKIASMSQYGEYIETVWGQGYAMHEPSALVQRPRLSAAA